MLCDVTGKALNVGRDINVPCNPLKLPAFAGEYQIRRLL